MTLDTFLAGALGASSISCLASLAPVMVIEETHSAYYGCNIGGVELGGTVFTGEGWSQLVKTFADSACTVVVSDNAIWYGSDTACIEQVISR